MSQVDPVAAGVFADADSLLGFALSSLCWDGPVQALNDTEHTQPALLTHAVAVLRAFQSRHPDFRPAFVAGHSLGELAALVAADVLPFPDALKLVRARGLAMKSAGLREPGGMAAVLGMDVDDVEVACRETAARLGGAVQVANDNCPGQVVVS